jgi:hypothetical protein
VAKIILLAIALISIHAPAFADADLLRCGGKDAVNLQRDGSLRKDASAEQAMGDTYLVDISTGIVRISGYGGTAHLGRELINTLADGLHQSPFWSHERTSLAAGGTSESRHKGNLLSGRLSFGPSLHTRERPPRSGHSAARLTDFVQSPSDCGEVIMKAHLERIDEQDVRFAPASP